MSYAPSSEEPESQNGAYFDGEVGNFRLKQVKDNLRHAMTKANRFLDTTLKVSEFEHRERIYDLEIDDAI